MRAINPSCADFAKLAKACGDGPVPFIVRLANDQHTPLGVFSNLHSASEHAFILESVETGVRMGRYSFMGAFPRQVMRYNEGSFTVADAAGWPLDELECSDPLDELENRMRPWRARWPAELEMPPLVGGLVGCLSYDCVHDFEPVGELLPDEIGLPAMTWMLTDFIVCFDHLHSHILLCKCVLPSEREGRAADELYDSLVKEADAFAKAHLRPASLSEQSVAEALEPAMPDAAEAKVESTANFDERAYQEIVERAQALIHAGEIFQVVPSRRYSITNAPAALDVYRSLRKLNPSSYMFALKLGGHEAVGSSPETQLRCINGELMMRPLAGTRPCGEDAAASARLAAELLADEKECAEHRMLVDLVRNDLGSVASSGSVEITRLLEVEHYSHVMHITSEVTAKLAEGKSVFDALRATFPAGTLSGTPKVRAMQIINDFEPVRRNLYGGLVGYIDFAGNCDSCIAIRMMVARGTQAFVQAGGGLVADSQPAAEFLETQKKAGAVLAALQEARRHK